MSTAVLREAPVFALAGNPNTGKSSLFNALTGIRQHVANYPGVTVERMTGTTLVGGREVTVLDLPGTYSLAAASPDEQIVIDVLCGRVADTPRPDAVICAVDATNLRRNLFLASQVSETGLPVVIALTMADEAEARGLRIDAARLSERLGVPVVPTVAPESRGIDSLRDAMVRPGRMRDVSWPSAVLDAAMEIERTARKDTGRDLTRAEALRLLFDVDATGWKGAEPVLALARANLKEAGIDPLSVEALIRYRAIDEALDGVVTRVPSEGVERAYRIDRWLTHRFWGLLAFSAAMLLVFSSIYWFAAPVMDFVDAAFSWLGNRIGGLLASTPTLRSLVVDGLIAGVGGVVIFLPQILVLFFFIAILEDSGYMSRAAFLMDKAFSWCGLNGKSFIPMLSSFACAVPAILGARTIEDRKARLATILTAPLMSCSARLPVYVLMIGAFIEPRYGALWAGAALFAMHLVGFVVAMPIAFCINRFMLKTRPVPFLLEMPPYRRPRARSVAWRMYRAGREFVVKAGTVILIFSVVIWALTYFPDTDAPDASARLEASYLGRAGRVLQPVFAPAGFDWKITVGVLASFPAREVIVSTLGIIYSVEEADEESTMLRERMAGASWPDGRPVFTPAVALAVMVFFALCLQCGSTVAVIARESSWKWAAFAFGYMTALAWLAAVVTYQVGTLITG